MAFGGGLEVVTKFTSDTSGLEQGAQKAKSALGGIGPEALLMGGAVVAGAGVAISALSGMVSAAAEDEAQQKKLQGAIEAAGAATDISTQQVNDAIAAGQARAFSDDQTREALMSLVTATGDVGTATEELATAQDLARFAGVDLATAADAVAKAHAGSDGALRKLIPGLEKGATAQDTLAAAQKAAAGQADEYSKTTEASLAIASDSFSELGETIGSAFLPLLKAIIPPLSKIIGALGTLIEAVLPLIIPLFEAVGIVIGAVVDALVPLVEFVAKLVTALARQLVPLLKPLAGIFEDVGKAIGGVVDWLSSLLGWIGKIVGAVGGLLDKLNPLKNFSLPSLPFGLAASTAGVTAGVGVRALGATPRAAGGGGGNTIIVNVGSAEPGEVIRALRRWSSANGGSAAFHRTLDRAGS